MYKFISLYILCLAPSDEGAVDCKLTVRQFTFYKSTEGGKNYKLDELIGYYLINLHYIIIPTNPNLDAHLSLYTRATGEYVQIQGNYIGQNNNKL